VAVTEETRTSPSSPAYLSPKPTPPAVALEEPLGYRMKNRLLGPPLNTDQLAHERLGKPTALAVFASDNLSSSAYATEEILKVLVPFFGVAAFAMVVPVTLALLVVLGFLILSYRQTIKAYPTAGGAYIVTRDNFGLLPAQVAGVALLTDYILTVAVSVSAGTAAIASAFSALAPYVVPISVLWIVLIAYGNLRGVKESGRVFAIPTYFFIVNMVLLMGLGLFRMAFGHLPVETVHKAGMMNFGDSTRGLLMGLAVWKILTAFANGGSAVTGVEAISNGVPAFRPPEWKNARETLVIMGSTLGAMFLGLSVLAAKMHVVPYESGTPTVISQIGKFVYGGGPVGTALYLALQAGTALILILAANTSFADFPRLASFHAGDNFMPRQLTKRGHRLVFSNGIIALAVAATVLVIVADAKVDNLIGLYAIGVFTSFTLSQAGMAKHHITHKEEGWRVGLFINGTGAALSAIVCTVIGLTKFVRGAWIVVIVVPLMVVLLVRLNRQYESEEEELEEDAPRAAEARALRRHVVLVLLDRLDLASARAIQYAKTLSPDELRAVHFDLDPIRTEDLSAAWQRLGLGRLTLDVVDCPDRRITRAAAEIVAEFAADGETEVTVLLPQLKHNRLWHRMLHDRTADSLSEALSRIPHAAVTIVPYHLGTGQHASDVPAEFVPVTPETNGKGNGNGSSNSAGKGGAKTHGKAAPALDLPPGCIPISSAEFRKRASFSGRIQSMRLQSLSGVASLEVRLTDSSGSMILIFTGRRQIAGFKPGVRLTVQGMVGEHGGRLAVINPLYEIVAAPDHELPPTSH
jgi:amino acid transporter